MIESTICGHTDCEVGMPCKIWDEEGYLEEVAMRVVSEKAKALGVKLDWKDMKWISGSLTIDGMDAFEWLDAVGGYNGD